jgi:hypothetical protein
MREPPGTGDLHWAARDCATYTEPPGTGDGHWAARDWRRTLGRQGLATHIEPPGTGDVHYVAGPMVMRVLTFDSFDG